MKKNFKNLICVKCGQPILEGIGCLKLEEEPTLETLGYFRDGELRFYHKGDLRHEVCPKRN